MLQESGHAFLLGLVIVASLYGCRPDVLSLQVHGHFVTFTWCYF